MRTMFAAAAIAAASANALDAMAIPDFVAGMIYGLTGDNHLTEIETCFTGAESLEQDTLTALHDLENGNLIKGAREIGNIINVEFPADLYNCENMGDDLAAIEEWASIFTDVGRLTKTVSKNWLLHRKTIKADIANEEAAWAAGQYFDAGKYTAEALTEAVGPIQSTNSAPANLDVLAVPDFVAGFMYGITGDNNLTEIETCFTGSEALLGDVKAALTDMENGNLIKGVKEFKQIASVEFPADMVTCHSMQDDLAALSEWASAFKDPLSLTGEVMKNWFLHKRGIKADLAEEKTAWAAGQYFDAGRFTADAMTLLIPVPEPTPANLDVMAVPDFVAGFMYGITGDNNLTEIESCFTGSEVVLLDIQNALYDMESGNLIKGVKEFGNVINVELPADMVTCHSMQDDLARLSEWGAAFKNPTSLVGEVIKNWAFHKRGIKSDLADEKTAWAAGEYFEAGRYTADAMTLLVPVPKQAEENFSIVSIPDFLAGFVYGLTEENHLTEFETCFSGAHDLEGYLMSFLGDLEHFEIIHAFEDFDKFLFHFQLDTQGCHNMQDDLTAVEEWASIFKNPTKLAETVTKNYLIHKRGIKADIADFKTEWGTSEFFKAGESIADLAVKALGPIQE